MTPSIHLAMQPKRQLHDIIKSFKIWDPLTYCASWQSFRLQGNRSSRRNAQIKLSRAAIKSHESQAVLSGIRLKHWRWPPTILLYARRETSVNEPPWAPQPMTPSSFSSRNCKLDKLSEGNNCVTV